jgi:hypothetical protein
MSMRPIRRIIIHCTATPEGRDVSAAEINDWHTARGWNGIGYHAVVRLDGRIEPGRPIADVGAHTRGHNDDSLGICYVGGVDADGRTPKDTRTLEQVRALAVQLRQWIRAYNIPPNQVFGHRDFDAMKACPSFDVEDMRVRMSLELDDESPLLLRAADLPVLDLRSHPMRGDARRLQGMIGADVDAIFGPQTYAAIAAALNRSSADTHTDDRETPA